MIRSEITKAGSRQREPHVHRPQLGRVQGLEGGQGHKGGPVAQYGVWWQHIRLTREFNEARDTSNLIKEERTAGNLV